MSVRSYLISLAAGLASLSMGVSVAGAGNTPVDDYWRDQPTAAVSNTHLVDDYWRDARLAGSTTPTAGDRIVDDYFRDAPRGVAVAPAGGDRLVDDYFRDAPTVVTPTDRGFGWGDFGIGIAVAVGAMLILGGVAAGVLALRLNGKDDRHPAGIV